MLFSILLRKLSLHLRTGVANGLAASFAMPDRIRWKHLSELRFAKHTELGAGLPFFLYGFKIEGFG